MDSLLLSASEGLSSPGHLKRMYTETLAVPYFPTVIFLDSTGWPVRSIRLPSPDPVLAAIAALLFLPPSSFFTPPSSLL